MGQEVVRRKCRNFPIAKYRTSHERDAADGRTLIANAVRRRLNTGLTPLIPRKSTP
jgi:hypothetical protein